MLMPMPAGPCACQHGHGPCTLAVGQNALVHAGTLTVSTCCVAMLAKWRVS